MFHSPVNTIIWENKNRMDTSTVRAPILNGAQHTALPKTMDLNQLGISLTHTHAHTLHKQTVYNMHYIQL